MTRCQLKGDCSNHRNNISVADAAEVILRSRGAMWDASRTVSASKQDGRSVNAADVHDVLVALTQMEAK